MLLNGVITTKIEDNEENNPPALSSLPSMIGEKIEETEEKIEKKGIDTNIIVIALVAITLIVVLWRGGK